MKYNLQIMQIYKFVFVFQFLIIRFKFIRNDSNDALPFVVVYGLYNIL